jgi:hypothetical protein
MNPTTTIPGPNAHFITPTAAAAMIAAYNADQETILAVAYKNQGILASSETFNRHAFDELLARQGCAALRIYYGMDASLRVHAIVVGVNASNEDILPPANAETEPADYIIETGQRCPDICPPASPINP